MITQSTLATIERTARDVAAFERRLANAKQRYQRYANPVIALLAAGEHVARGSLIVAVKIHRRRAIAWRREFEAKLGREEIQRIVNLCVPKERRELLITRRLLSTRALSRLTDKNVVQTHRRIT